MLTFSIEPSDVLLALLRLRASAEAGRWPRDLSARFRTATEREFQRLEQCIRVIGVCFAELEERRVAELDRRPQSRFADIDGALHLAACSIDVALELDHLRMAVDRGDQGVRESAASLATALRNVLWYVVHSDLLVCPLILLGGAEMGPERGLAFVESFLARAWTHAGPPDPPLPRDAKAVDSSRSPLALEDEHPALPYTESTAVFMPGPDPDHLDHDDEQPLLEDMGDEMTAPAEAAGHEQRVMMMSSQQEATHPALDLDPDDHPASGMHPRLRVDLDQNTVPGRSLSERLTPDALFFLDESGVPWPCNASQLNGARAVLMVRTPTPDSDGWGHADARAWVERVERGFAELRERLSW